MDPKLVAWARAVKSRLGDPRLPRLWLFTDAGRMPDPRPAIARLPRGLGGVVFRHDGVVGRSALAGLVARQCRRQGLALVVAGDVRLAVALGAGVHLRDGRWPGPRRRMRGWVTSSAHGVASLRRAKAAGAMVVFLSPVFPTRSHVGGLALGPVGWARLSRQAGLPVMALGGVGGGTARRLPRRCAGAGAIGALSGGALSGGPLAGSTLAGRAVADGALSTRVMH